MIQIKNNIIVENKVYPLLLDAFYKPNKNPKSVLIFCHGFKGFKDWGPFNKMGEYFAKQDIVYIKFNFSHNGTSIDDLVNFPNLDAFGKNNFSIELEDLGCIIDWVYDCELLKDEVNTNDISIMGHSRGGGIAILKAASDIRLSKLITWASPSDFLEPIINISEEKLNSWKEKGVAYIYNGRTKQNMPVNYQFYEDCINNKKKLSILDACTHIKIPQLIIHGDKDPTVPVNAAKDLKKNNPRADLHIVKNADHVFNSSHPFISVSFPDALQESLDITLNFLKD